MSKYFDKIDEYITGRLGEAERVDFESEMDADRTLKNEVEFRQLLIKKIQSARVKELKNMLGKVPVAVGIGLLASRLTPMKALLAVATITASVLTWYYVKYHSSNEPYKALGKQVEKPKDTLNKSSVVSPPMEKTAALKDTPKKPRRRRIKAPAAVAPPTVSMPDISAEDTAAKEPAGPSSEKDTVSNKKTHSFLLEVEVHPALPAYPLSYKFENDTLMLYGDPGRNPYKILDFFSPAKYTLYIFFADNYYRLDKRRHEIQKLEPLTDPTLINQLKKIKDKKE